MYRIRKGMHMRRNRTRTTSKAQEVGDFGISLAPPDETGMAALGIVKFRGDVPVKRMSVYLDNKSRKQLLEWLLEYTSDYKD